MAKQRKTIVPPCTDLHFGEIIRRTAEGLGVKQREFAKRLGVKQPRITEIYQQESMTEALLDRCMAALGASLEVRVIV